MSIKWAWSQGGSRRGEPVGHADLHQHTRASGFVRRSGRRIDAGARVGAQLTSFGIHMLVFKSILLFCLLAPWFSTDHEYLYNTNGSVFILNVATGGSSEFLSKDRFVSRPPPVHPCGMKTTSHPTQSQYFPLVCVLSWGETLNKSFLFPGTEWNRGLRLPAVRWPKICCIYEQSFQGTISFRPHESHAYLNRKHYILCFFSPR